MSEAKKPDQSEAVTTEEGHTPGPPEYDKVKLDSHIPLPRQEDGTYLGDSHMPVPPASDGYSPPGPVLNPDDDWPEDPVPPAAT